MYANCLNYVENAKKSTVKFKKNRGPPYNLKVKCHQIV